MRAVRAALVLALCGCGTLTSPGAGDHELPTGRGGPYRLLGPDELDSRACVIEEFGAALSEPSALVGAEGTAVYFTRTRDGRSTIHRAVLNAGLRAEGSAEVLTPTQRWQGMSVASPSVRPRPGSGFVMAYASDGGIGVAESDDGRRWTVSSSAALVSDVRSGETTALRGPSLHVEASGARWIFYESAGAIWAARADSGTAPFARVDVDPSTPRRDPALAPRGTGPLGSGTAGYLAGSVGDPELLVETTSSGRTLWRMFFTARSAPVALDGGTRADLVVGVAGSFDGRAFAPAAFPSLSARSDLTLDAPTVVPEGALRTRMFVSGTCSVSSQRRGIRVAVHGFAPPADAGE